MRAWRFSLPQCSCIRCWNRARARRNLKSSVWPRQRTSLIDAPAKQGSPCIWVDADACPNVIKDILFRAAERARVETILVANQRIRTPPSRFVRSIQVTGGLDAADEEIVSRIKTGDLVITADIPLAARVLEKGALALNPRGELYTSDSIGQRLSMRNFMDELRGAGVNTGGPAGLHPRDRQAFANQLDTWLSRQTS
ncbi:MAG: YaiI/YqxD family protein [Elusimicrobia bacterium]|nr:MAG: YaiI/YqxD family protein [Gammaproteobacteria bacterium]TXH28940.1 MAG: YaiI/YqxD family protein [Elusimicrobiota bacterium]